MKIRVLLSAVAVVALGLARVPASSSFMPIEEVRPGMDGVGRTIFQGAEQQEF